MSYLYEDDDMTMDVQVGPETEIEVNNDTNPVAIAKMDPDSVVVAGKESDDHVCEFYVDAGDVLALADVNESTIMEALNAIIACNEETGVSAQNLVMVMDESTMHFVQPLEEAGVTCMRVLGEADEIEMDVQIGPNGDEVRVAEDPQEANPVDAVKRQYNTVVVAKQGDEFFTDVEDVQKCADINCESVIETLNGIIACNEDAGVSAQNLVVITNEYALPGVEEAMAEAGVVMCESATSKTRKAIGKKAVSIINAVLLDNSISGIRASKGFYNPIQSSKFNRGKSDQLIIRLLFRASALDASRDMDAAMGAIKKGKSSILRDLTDAAEGYKFSNLRFNRGVGSTIDVIIDCEAKLDD